MSQDWYERHVYKHQDPELFEHMEGLMFSGATSVDLGGVVEIIGDIRHLVQ